MTVTVYGEKIHCEECGSDNTVEREREMYLETTGHTTYPAVVCQTCGWERSL